MRKTLTIIQRVVLVISILFLVNLGVQIIETDIAENGFYATLAIYYGSESAALYYEAYRYKTKKEEISIEFLPHQSFKYSHDFINYKQTNNILIEQSEMWKLKHDKVKKQYICQNATIHLFVMFLFLICLFQ